MIQDIDNDYEKYFIKNISRNHTVNNRATTKGGFLFCQNRYKP